MNRMNITSKIVGILKLSSRVKYGNNKRGIPYYKFKPSNKDYPIFLVCSKNRINKDVFAFIYPTNIIINKFKKGNLDSIIGEVGNIINEYKYILYQNNVYYKFWENILRKSNLNNKIKKDIEYDNELQKIKHEYNVLSIDPDGCSDIDDALHIKIKDNIVEIGVHITNVNYYLNDELENLIKQRLFSVYSPFNQQNMIPDIYASHLCSLLENKKRKTISIIYKFVLNKPLQLTNIPLDTRQKLYKVISTSFEIKESIVHNNKNYTYNEVDKIKKLYLKYSRIEKYNNILNKKLNENEKMIYNLFNFMDNVLKRNIDSHKLVEYFMIKANTTVGNYLFNKLKDKTIVRCHTESETKDSPLEIKDYVNLRLMKKANYSFANLDTSKNKHFGLNLFNYTHFTSPIRRYNDILIHKQILNILNSNYSSTETNINQEIINLMNNKQKDINKSERMIRRLTIINQLENEYQVKPIETHAYIINKEDNNFSIYIPKYKLEERIYDITHLNIYDKCNIIITPFLKEIYYWNKIKINIL